MISYFVLLLLGMMMSAIYSGLETGIYSMNRIRIQLLAEKNYQEKKLFAVLQKPQEMVTSALIGNNLSHYMCTIACTGIVFHLQIKNAEIVSTILLTPFLFMFAEILPKELFRRYADSLMFRLSWGLQISYWIFYPFVVILLALGKFWSYILQQNPVKLQISRQKIKLYLLEKSGLSRKQSQLTNNIFHLEEQKVSHVMKLLKKAVLVRENISQEELLELARHHKYTRYPVYKESPFQVIGFIHIYDIVFAQSDFFSLQEHIHPIPHIPTKISVLKAIEILQKQAVPLGVVVDKYGNIMGIITLKDLINEVVGTLQV